MRRLSGLLIGDPENAGDYAGVNHDGYRVYEWQDQQFDVVAFREAGHNHRHGQRGILNAGFRPPCEPSSGA